MTLITTDNSENLRASARSHLGSAFKFSDVDARSIIWGVLFYLSEVFIQPTLAVDYPDILTELIGENPLSFCSPGFWWGLSC